MARAHILAVGLLLVGAATGCPADDDVATGDDGVAGVDAADATDASAGADASGADASPEPDTSQTDASEDATPPADAGGAEDVADAGSAEDVPDAGGLEDVAGPVDGGGEVDASDVADGGAPDTGLEDTPPADGGPADAAAEDAPGPDAALGDASAGDASAGDDGAAEDVFVPETCDGIDCGVGTCQAGQAVFCDCPQGHGFDGATCVLDVLPPTPFSDPRWTVTNGTVDPTTGFFSGSEETACADGGVSTEVTLPASTPDTLLVVEAKFTWSGCAWEGAETDPLSCWDGGTEPRLTLGGRPLPTGQLQWDAANTVVACIGAFAYQEDPVTLSLEAALDWVDEEPCQLGDGWFDALESLVVREAAPGECPGGGGAVDNGTFATGDASGWTVLAEGPAPKGVVPDGEGYAYSFGANSIYCDQLTLRTAVAPPAAASVTTGLALDVRMSTTGSRFDYALRLGDNNGHSLTASDRIQADTEVTERLCLPPWAYGGVEPLEIQFSDFQGTLLSDCSSAEVVAELKLHHLEVVEDASCPLTPPAGETFEQASPVWWTERRHGNGNLPGTNGVMVDPDGTSFWRFDAVETCMEVAAQTDLVPPVGSTHARVTYRYSASESGGAYAYGGVSFFGASKASQVIAAPTAEWQQVDLCVNAWNAWEGLSVRMSASTSGLCADPATATLDVAAIEFVDLGPCTPN